MKFIKWISTRMGQMPIEVEKKKRHLEVKPDLTNPFCDEYLDPQIANKEGAHVCCYGLNKKCIQFNEKECVGFPKEAK